MVATATRFMRKGITKIYFIPTITVLSAPTTAQVTAGTNLTPQVAEVAGFTFTNNPISTPDMDNAYVSQIAGEDTGEASSITFYELRAATDTIHDAQTKGLNGYIGIYYGGIAGGTPAAADKLEVWPVSISSNARIYSAGNEAAQYRVAYAITGAPVAAVQGA